MDSHVRVAWQPPMLYVTSDSVATQQDLQVKTNLLLQFPHLRKSYISNINWGDMRETNKG